MNTVLIVDASHWQKPGLPWATFRAHGVAAGIVQITHGLTVEPYGSNHLVEIAAAGLLCGVYHWLTPGDDPRAQARFFLAQIPAGFHGRVAVDVEQARLTAAVLDAFVDEFRQSGRRLWIYTASGVWHTLIGHHVARYSTFPLWAAGGPGYDQVESLPPAGYTVGLPDTWTGAGMEQFTGHGRVVGYPGDLDLSFAVGVDTAEALALIWEDTLMTETLVPQGSFVGMHSIEPGNTIPSAAAAYLAGLPYAGFIYLNDGQVGVDLARVSPPSFRLLRYFNAELDGMQGLPTWNLAQMADYCKSFLDHIEQNATDAQIAAAHAILDCNEEDPPELVAGGAESYAKLRDLFIMLIRACEVRNSARRAQGRPEIHLGLLTFPQGVPEYDEDLALIGDGTLFLLMEQYGHWAIFHEGVYKDQPIDLGYGQGLPGVAPLWNAGPYNFRFVYLYAELLRRHLPIPRTAMTEFYDGAGYPGDPAEHARRFGWYDAGLASLPPEIARRVAFFSGFTCNPNNGWQMANYDNFYGSPELLALRGGVRTRNNLGGKPMSVTLSDPDFQALQSKLADLSALVARYNLHTLAGHTDQDIINLFKTAFGADSYWTVIQSASLTALAVNRTAPYQGPAIENMNLNDAQKQKLIAALPQ